MPQRAMRPWERVVLEAETTAEAMRKAADLLDEITAKGVAREVITVNLTAPTRKPGIVVTWRTD